MNEESPRLARVYDGRDESGHPIAVREALPWWLREGIISYLEHAPIVLAARSFDVDEFAPSERDVPLTFRTDGVWIWSGSVPHYLRKHDLPPEPELVQHIIDRGFQHGEISAEAKDLALKVITSG